MAATPPPELKNAIATSSARYGVPTDILTGVWIKESGANFPNNYVNSSGYGGLFGTTNWNGSTQSQSDYAASILAHWKGVYGSWSDALYKYSGGGYTSVPGQTTPGGSFTLIPSKSNTSGSSNTSNASASTPSSSNPLDIAGAINNLGSTLGNIPNTIISDFKPSLINIGLGTLGIWLIVSGTLIIAFMALNKVAEQPAVQTATKAV